MIYNPKLQTLDIQKEIGEELLNIYGWCQENKFFSTDKFTNGTMTWNILNYKENGKDKFNYIKKVLQNVLPKNTNIYKIKYIHFNEKGCFNKRMYKTEEENSFIITLKGGKVTIDFSPFEKINLKKNEMAFFSSDLEHNLEPLEKETIIVIGGSNERKEEH